MLRVIKATMEDLNLMNMQVAEMQKVIIRQLTFFQQFEKDLIAATDQTQPSTFGTVELDEEPAAAMPEEDCLHHEELPHVSAEQLKEMPAAIRSEVLIASNGLKTSMENFKRAYSNSLVSSPAAKKTETQLPQEEPAEADTIDLLAERTAELKEVFRQGLSSKIIPTGCGFLEPKKGTGMLQYSSDILRTPPQVVKQWPSGFYRDVNTKAVQVFINCADYLFIVANVFQQDSTLIVINTAHGGVVQLENEAQSVYTIINDRLRSTILTLSAQS